MKDFATLPETLEVKGLTLSTLEVADRKDNFGHLNLLLPTVMRFMLAVITKS